MTRIYFGDPAHPRALRDLLEARTDAVPAGGEIVWATYYFRDERLADALVRAHRRGVRVEVSVEGHARTPQANHAVIARLGDPVAGIGKGLRVIRRGLVRHLHEKLFYFSHPEPVVLAGSFNPSGNDPEDPAILRRIGDQDRGHNFLAEIVGTPVAPLVEHARALHRSGRFVHFPARWQAPIRAGTFTAYLFPRLTNPLKHRLKALPPGSRLRIAASHLRDPDMGALLGRVARRGVGIAFLTEATTRRVPPGIEAKLRARGIAFTRYRRPDHLPMHNKFLLAETPGGQCWCAFGSFNLTRTSRWLNTELLMVSEDPQVFAAFAACWEAMEAEIGRQGMAA